MNSFVEKFDTPNNSKLAKISSLNLCSKSHIFLNTSWIPANESSKFKLDCVESKTSYILLIDAINFELALIKFVYFFETPHSLRMMRVHFWKGHDNQNLMSAFCH